MTRISRAGRVNETQGADSMQRALLRMQSLEVQTAPKQEPEASVSV
jgi:hypothetical protein